MAYQNHREGGEGQGGRRGKGGEREGEGTHLGRRGLDSEDKVASALHAVAMGAWWYQWQV